MQTVNAKAFLQVFDGNSGRNDIVKHNLQDVARASLIRFQPTAYSTHKALRVEVFGILTAAGISLPTLVSLQISYIMINLVLIALPADNKLILDHLSHVCTEVYKIQHIDGLQLVKV